MDRITQNQLKVHNITTSGSHKKFHILCNIQTHTYITFLIETITFKITVYFMQFSLTINV